MPAISIRKCKWRIRDGVAGLCALWVLLPSEGLADALRLKVATALDPAIASPAGAHGAAPAATYQEAFVEVDVNRQHVDKTILVLRRDDGMFLIAADDLPVFRLKAPASAGYRHDGKTYYPLDALPDAMYSFDEARQSLSVTVGARGFAATAGTVPGSRTSYPPTLAPTPGGFVNYTLSASRGGGSGTNEAGLVEAGIFDRHGVLVSDALASNQDGERHWLRLDTTFTADFPERMASLRVGDAIVRPAAWGRAVRFGGVQFGTNFGTRPGFLTFPLQSAAGQATLPSVVDVFVNNALVSSRSIAPGPFSINNIPVVTGSGDVRLVVRDILGREQVFVQPFYGSNSLLRAGLSDYSVELGALRNDFGIASDDYGPGVAAGTYRLGVTDRFTGEVHAEATPHLAAAGLAATVLAPRLGLFDAAIAGSSSRARGSGSLAMLGFQSQNATLNLGFNGQWTSARFDALGLEPGQSAPRLQATASLGAQLGAFGAATLAYITQSYRDRDGIQLASLGYSVPLGKWGDLNFTAVKTFGSQGSTSVSTTFTIPIDALTSASVSHDRTRGPGVRDDVNAFTLQRNLPPGEGYGYRVDARNSDLQAQASVQNNVGTYTAELARFAGQDAERVSASGGFGFVGGHAFASRAITGSFGVVQVADYPDVRVLLENQPAGRTNARGFAVLPELRPYDRNTIAIDQADLPMDAQVERLSVVAAPYFRSGLLIDFPVKHVHAATLRVVLEDGRDMPSGALATVEGAAEDFPVALHGELYLSGLTQRQRVQVAWKHRACTLDVPYHAGNDPLPNLGTFICHGVTP